ncbi:MAG: arylsulfatase [Planctomycetota bacterium]|jgi:arylsulfatase A-like enzyme|nr:arylsulfatase [Planctomycetota bacterium]
MKTQPNVVFVITDDQGYGDLGCHGNPVIQTPNLDAFHSESVRLTNYHVGPTCAPTRSGIMTGHYANSTGVWHTIGGRSLLRKNEWTLASALQDAGYRTGIFGKWHLGDAYPYRPHDRGFDVSIVHGGGGISQTPDYWGNDYFDDTYFVNGEPEKFEGYCTDVWFEQGMKFIEENKDRPFFAYIPTNAPHGPYNVENKYSELYHDSCPEARARFYGMITNIDENFGKLHAKLKELELEDNTILVFMTDNGSSGASRLDKNAFPIDGFNAGLRGLKGSPYDGGHRVPFFIRWPNGNVGGGQDVNHLTANVDFMPTILDLCGVEVPSERTFHGQSVKQLLHGDDEGWPARTMVTDSQRLTNPVKWRQSSVMTDRWRLINGKELYDINEDREQRSDIAGRHPDVVEELRVEYEKWWDIVSTKFEEDIPISLGADPAKETLLTCHDWRNEDCDCPWNQGHIRRGHEANGYWEIEIEQEGDYEFELRRWPKEAGHAVTAGIDGDDIEWRRDAIPEGASSLYTGGKAMPLTVASLRIGDQEQSSEIAEAATSATFKMHLAPGPAHLQTTMSDGEGLSIGAYYINVRLLES